MAAQQGWSAHTFSSCHPHLSASSPLSCREAAQPPSSQGC
jgi:hypothetical protein